MILIINIYINKLSYCFITYVYYYVIGSCLLTTKNDLYSCIEALSNKKEF